MNRYLSKDNNYIILERDGITITFPTDEHRQKFTDRMIPIVSKHEKIRDTKREKRQAVIEDNGNKLKRMLGR